MSKVTRPNANQVYFDPATGKLTVAGVQFFNALFDRIGGTTAPTNTDNSSAAASAQSTANTAVTNAATAQSTADGAQTTANSAQADATSALNGISTLSAIQYLTFAASGALANERVLTAGAGVKFTDSGSGAALTVAIDSNVSLKDSLGATQFQVADGKAGLFGVTPASQPTTSITGSVFVANAGTAVNDASTFGGYTIKQVVAALKSIGALA